MVETGCLAAMQADPAAEARQGFAEVLTYEEVSIE
jgi:hypothetical protein